MQRLNPSTLAAPPENSYAQITIAPAGRLAFISGQAATDKDGQLVGAGDHAAQARQCFLNLRAALAAIDSGPEHIARMTIAIVGHRPDLIQPIFATGREIFGAAWPITASMLLGVQCLALPDWLIEIDAIVSLRD